MNFPLLSDTEKLLHVATPYTNPQRWQTRRRLMIEFRAHMAENKAVRLYAQLRGTVSEVLREMLLRRVIGQAEAIEEIISTYSMYESELAEPGRPIANFLFLGPTGSGKTRTVEVTAEALLGKPDAFTKIDCAEFQHSHEIAKLIGSPPGYIGHRETEAMLSQQRLDKYYTEKVQVSIVLFDEIEKASNALWNLLLGVLDKGTLMRGDNQRLDFTRSMIFMTSNVGVREIESLTTGGMGFTRPIHARESTEKTARDAARRKFTPEFLNRLDKIVTFKPLSRESLEQILDLELNRACRRVSFSLKRMEHIRFTKEARTFLLDEGTDAKYGARHLKRAIRKHFLYPTANLIASGEIAEIEHMVVDINEDQTALSFFDVNESERLAA